jgi:hypothetical protein
MRPAERAGSQPPTTAAAMPSVPYTSAATGLNCSAGDTPAK